MYNLTANDLIYGRVEVSHREPSSRFGGGGTLTDHRSAIQQAFVDGSHLKIALGRWHDERHRRHADGHRSEKRSANEQYVIVKLSEP